MREHRKWYNQIQIKPPTPKGKIDTYNKAAIKWKDGKQSYYLFLKTRYRLWTVSDNLLGGLSSFTGFQSSTSASIVVKTHISSIRVEVITGNR